MFSQSSLFLALAASGSAHMIMGTPKPFQFENSANEQAPLAMADFPCKMPGGSYISQGVTQWAAGSQQTVSFIGGATHGGGSCQFSITTDPKPTKNSQWKVIESVIGGCPSDQEGNLSGDPNDTRSNKYPVTMPKDVPSGTYTFAWTWINKIGNREFYMNCAPIQVTGGSGSTDALAALPDMYVANLDATCATSAGQDFQYPNPGTNVVTGSKATPGNKFDATSGCAAMNKMGAGNGQLGSPSQSQPSGTPAQASQPASKPSSTGKAGGVFAPGASSAPATPAASAPAASAPAASAPAASAPAASAPAASAPAPAQPTASSSPNSSQPNNSSNSGNCNACSNDGAIVCIGSSQFGLCNRGCAVAQDLAAGTVCSNGVIMGASKRAIHFPRGHLHRRHGSSLL